MLIYQRVITKVEKISRTNVVYPAIGLTHTCESILWWAPCKIHWISLSYRNWPLLISYSQLTMAESKSLNSKSPGFTAKHQKFDGLLQKKHSPGDKSSFVQDKSSFLQYKSIFRRARMSLDSQKWTSRPCHRLLKDILHRVELLVLEFKYHQTPWRSMGKSRKTE